MPNDSILTRAEVESRQRDNIAMRVGECAALNTITQAVELLKKWDKHSDMTGQRYMTVSQHMLLKIETMEWLARYHAADSSPQSQPSPPQK